MKAWYQEVESDSISGYVIGRKVNMRQEKLRVTWVDNSGKYLEVPLWSEWNDRPDNNSILRCVMDIVKINININEKK